MKVLVPIDGSIYSDNALEYICNRSSLREKTDTIFLLNVQKKNPISKNNKKEYEVAQLALDEAAKEVLKPAKKRLETAGYKVKAMVRCGKATNNIVDCVNEIKANLIVMGSHGRTPVKGVLFGSKTASVLASTKVPMLIIRHKFVQTGKQSQIGICVDGSEYSSAAIEFIKKRLPIFDKNAVFHLINVIASYNGLLIPEAAAFGGPSMSREEFAQEQRKPFDEKIIPLCQSLRENHIEAKIVSLVGDAAEEIAKYAKDNGLSLLVLGTHGRNSFKSMMLGSTAMRIGSLCGLPMLLVHHKED